MSTTFTNAGYSRPDSFILNCDGVTIGGAAIGFAWDEKDMPGIDLHSEEAILEEEQRGTLE